MYQQLLDPLCYYKVGHWDCRVSIAVHTASKRCKISTWCAYKSNRNWGQHFNRHHFRILYVYHNSHKWWPNWAAPNLGIEITSTVTNTAKNSIATGRGIVKSWLSFRLAQPLTPKFTSKLRITWYPESQQIHPNRVSSLALWLAVGKYVGPISGQ